MALGKHRLAGPAGFALPFGDLIEATGRVEAGDYSARSSVPRRGHARDALLTEAFNSMAARLETDERQRAPPSCRRQPRAAHAAGRPARRARGDDRRRPPIDEAPPDRGRRPGRDADQARGRTSEPLALAERARLTLRKEPTDLTILGSGGGHFVRRTRGGGRSASAGADARRMPLVDLDSAPTSAG